MAILPSYVLITPAHNEAAFIERTIESMVHQTVLPLKWVIVDDGSTDGTAEIVSRYLRLHRWIELVRRPSRRERTFAAKVEAFNAGFERVRALQYDVVGNLDADISFDPDYCEFVLGKLGADDDLGVAGTIFREEGYSSETDSFEGHQHVAGGCQLFRRRCFEEIGGFRPNKAGGVDWIAVTTARMMGWKTRSFRERSFFHYRALGSAGRTTMSRWFAYGEKDYYLGSHPLWQLFRIAYRTAKPPHFIAGFALGAGYAWALLRRHPRPVSRDLVSFRRAEQMAKLRSILKSLLTLKRIDSFKVSA